MEDKILFLVYSLNTMTASLIVPQRPSWLWPSVFASALAVSKILANACSRVKIPRTERNGTEQKIKRNGTERTLKRNGR